jgi:4-alpha-glucanotransferase
VGKLAVLPAQDLLDLGAAARLNRPGTISGNWSWRLPQESLTQALALRYRDLNQLYNRGT